MHAAATYQALRSVHLASVRARSPDNAVRQVEWGAYECTLRGSQVRQVIERALAPEQDWRSEPLETFDSGRNRVDLSVWPHGSAPTLGWLHEQLDDGHVYLLTAEIFE